MAVTYADVARLAGTSTAVVSYVLNDGPRGVAPETRQRVLQAAAELGYRPNRLARGLRRGATGMIGILAPDSSIPFFAELTRTLVAELGRRGLLPIVIHAGLSGLSEVEAVSALLSARVDGLLVTAFWQEDHSGLEPGIPLVYVHHRPDGAAGVLIESDNAHATSLAVKHLKSHRITRPMFWAGPDDLGPLGVRTRAWRAAIGEPSADPIRSFYSADEAEKRFLELAHDHSLPRGIVAATDQQAFGILAGAYETRIRVPEDLAVISLDGSPESAFTAPPLTVIAQPMREIAARAVATLVGSAAESAGPPLGTLVVRRSCGC